MRVPSTVLIMIHILVLPAFKLEPLVLCTTGGVELIMRLF